MDLEALLSVMDRAAANLAKLEAVWVRASAFIPDSPARGSNPEYDDHRRAWADLLPGLPLIDGWTITDQLPDIDEMGQSFIDYADIGELPVDVWEAGEKPAKDLADYRYRLHRARRRAVAGRLQQLQAQVEIALPSILQDVPRASRERLVNPSVSIVTSAVSEIERLLGDTAERKGRWGDLHRHISFGEGHDWHDIAEFDWPSIQPDIDSGALSDSDPLPVPDLDLGSAAAGSLTGVATIALPWDRLDDDKFERLLYDLLRDFSEHENVQWLMHTRAPDRGRDLSLDRVIRDGTGGVRSERVIVQAKHWLKRSVDVAALAATVAAVKLWEPPVVRGLVMATSGRFTADAVAWAEQHNESGSAPYIELWPDSRLETLLAQKPHLAAAHGLR
ncbi:restriction endonuclease [Streptomyces sp. NBC_00322]|uniref:restriction endonuclease n=1 Tax=Streptomyces sp. NBC_00322 TaxID=2975712 RepID=UPI002E2AB70F|nr:restriction endonuclease [Streptomyces sp. NBC_00322]